MEASDSGAGWIYSSAGSVTNKEAKGIFLRHLFSSFGAGAERRAGAAAARQLLPSNACH
jgi:hypothetical protein